jgi:hypothetical protein
MVWTAGALTFDEKWIKKHGTVPTGEWLNVFAAFDENQVTAGVRRMRLEAERRIRTGELAKDIWPPSAFEFACYCKKADSLYFAENTSYQKQIPRIRTTPEYARQQRENLRKKFGV